MCVAMAESAPISLETISCTMLASGPSTWLGSQGEGEGEG